MRVNKAGKLHSHHEEGEIAIAEHAEDDERHREEAEPQQDVHVLFSDGTHDPGVDVEKRPERVKTHHEAGRQSTMFFETTVRE